jgi:hypothetical protein
MARTFIKYIGTGLLLAYALRGGCDHNIEDIFREKYSRPMIATRKVASDFVFKKTDELYKKIEAESNKTKGDAK